MSSSLRTPPGSSAHARGRGARPGESARAAPRRASTASARCAGCQKLRRASWQALATSMLSSTVRSPYSCGIWNERATPRRVIARGASARDVAAVEADAAGVGLEVAGDHVDEGGLAGAVAADQADALAGARRSTLMSAAATTAPKRLRRAPRGLAAAARSWRAHPRASTASRCRRGRKRITNSRNSPSASCQVFGKVRAGERAHHLEHRAGDEHRGHAVPAGQDGDEDELARGRPEAEVAARCGRATSRPARRRAPPQNAASTKLIAIAWRTEPPRYSTRSSFSRTASVTRPRVLSK